MQTKANRSLGFTLVEIMIVVAIIGLLCGIAVPNLVRARTTSQANACLNNLRLIDAAKQEWALEANAKPTDVPLPINIQPYLGRGMYGTLPFCPVDSTRTFAKSYTINTLKLPPTCNFFYSDSLTNHMLDN